MATQETFRQEVEDFLARHDMAAATLGVQALKDPKFVSDLRRGRSPSLKTIDRVDAWMADYDRAHPAPAIDEQAVTAQKMDPPAASQASPERDGLEATTPPEERSGRAKSWRRLTWAVVLLAGLVGAGAVGWPWLGPRVGSVWGSLWAGWFAPAAPTRDQQAAPIDALATRLAALEARLAEQRPRIEAELAAAKAETMARLAALTARVDALERAAPSAARPEVLAATLGELKTAIEDLRGAGARAQVDLSPLEQRLAGLARALAGERAMRRLREAVASGQPFVPEVAVLAGLLTGGPPPPSSEVRAALGDLRGLSETGVVPLTRLLAETPDPQAVIAGVPASKIQRPASANWWAKTRAQLAALVRVRRIDAPRARLGARLMRIRTALAEQAPKRALGEFAGFQKPLGPALAAWRRDIESYARARAALSVVDAAVGAPKIEVAAPVAAAPQSGPSGE